MHSSLGGGIHSPGFRGGGRRSPVGGPSPTEMLTAAASASSVMTSLSKIPGPQPVPAPVTVGTRGAPPPFRHPPDHPAVTPPPPAHIGKTVFLKNLDTRRLCVKHIFLSSSLHAMRPSLRMIKRCFPSYLNFAICFQSTHR